MKNRFDKDAPSWDEKSHKVKLATDIAESIRQKVQLNPDMDILDFGCGTGLVSLGFAGMVKSLAGVDNSAGMLQVFKEKADTRGLKNVTSINLNLAGGDRLSGSYDLILSSMTLHHVEEILPLLSKLFAALRPGGMLCIADLDLDYGFFHSDNKGVHHFGFDRESLMGQFRSVGLRNVEARTAATISRTGSDGINREFSVFLVTGKRDAKK
jgi:2-polyprenyl-3-methyl-5-hydroxy-6-metoxy-1,4-benzoquinol methylase